MSEHHPNHRPHLLGVIEDLCHQLGVNTRDVLAIQIGPGTVDVALRANTVLFDGSVGVWRRYTYPLDH
jgi:hypothetical protein